MSEFESKDTSSDSTIEIGKRYAETSYKYLKLKVFHLLTTNITLLSKILVLGTLFSIGLIFLSFSGAIALGNFFGNMSLGYLIIALVFFLLVIVMYFVRGFISKKIIKSMSDIFFEASKK